MRVLLHSIFSIQAGPGTSPLYVSLQERPHADPGKAASHVSGARFEPDAEATHPFGYARWLRIGQGLAVVILMR